MSKIEQELIEKARARYGRISPCSGKTFLQCFTRQNGKIEFWFNDANGNTHLLYIEQAAYLLESR